MATPDNLEDLAIGFSITDGLCSPDEIQNVCVEQSGTEDTIEVDVQLNSPATKRFLRRRRVRSNLSFTSCGVCGIESLSDLPCVNLHCCPSLVSEAAIGIALLGLSAHQPLNSRTGAAHAAAWIASDGTIVLVREDIGRHNALDKLIGARARNSDLPGDGFCLVTSRCSFEMAQKAIAAGISTIVCISAPTSLAINYAERAGLTLIALARADSQIVYAGLDQVQLSGSVPQWRDGA